MRKGGPSYMREAAFKSLGKGELNESGNTLEGEEESNLSRTFNGVLQDSEVNYLSNVFLVEE